MKTEDLILPNKYSLILLRYHSDLSCHFENLTHVDMEIEEA